MGGKNGFSLKNRQFHPESVFYGKEKMGFNKKSPERSHYPDRIA